MYRCCYPLPPCKALGPKESISVALWAVGIITDDAGGTPRRRNIEK